ncbi:programmed cell death 6-interacting protein [Euwallacea similis]|uniref:programmed cell death 6-interacting protein n=1 Tax=Euwallacea similis TaxID=1736056 RepID=UPI00344B2FDD
MADLISVPLKKPSEVDIITPFKNLIQSRYSTADNPENCTEAVNEFSKLRNNAIWKAFEKYESSLEIIYGYYDQLVALESKIPAQELQVPFKWKDAFDKGNIFGHKASLTIPSLSYEKVCVLFNIAALQSAVAATQSIENDDGLKLAAKLLQQASGIFSHLKSTVMLSIQHDPTPDLNPDTLGALSQLMLTQAQELFVHKAIHENMKLSLIAKLAAQADDLYAECLKTFQRENLRSIWDKDWISMIGGKQAAFSAVAELYQSFVCKENKSVGEEIARLRVAIDKFKAAQSRAGKTFFNDLLNKAERNLVEVEKDNDFIYHERIPDYKSLEPIGKTLIAKTLPLPERMSQNFKDLFSTMVPVAVHQALASYDVRKSDIVNTEITKLRDATQELNGILASLNLPAAIEDSSSGLPPSIIEKANTVTSLGGISSLRKMIEELPEALKRNQDILDETDRMLNEEKAADDTLRQQFKERWTRTPSEKLTEMLRSNAGKYRQIINNAVEADKVVQTKFNTHKPMIELLSKSPAELESSLPSGNGGNVQNYSAVATLRNLMEEVETVKAERDTIESEIKSATTDMKDKFLLALAKEGEINEPALSYQSLGQTYSSLQKQVSDSLQKQKDLIDRIRKAHQDFSSERGSTAGGRETMLCQLAAAHDVFRDLSNNLKEGTKFYNDLTQLLLTFQNKVSDFCFARKTEKEELMKDLTQESSRSSSAAPPAAPSYYSDPNPAPSPSNVTTPQPGQVPPNLPYPVHVQGMPVPYGATANVPYPSYVPPPMPQGYNPYGTWPGNYQNYPQQQYAPGTYPQGAYPQNTQQPGYRPPW